MAQPKTMQILIEMSGKLSPTLTKSLQSASKYISGVNIKALAFSTAVAAVGVKVGKTLLDMGKQFDQAADTIRIGTGTTGKDLEGLVNSFDNVYKTVPTTMDNASKTIADYNTRLGITGNVLENVSKQAIQASAMLGEDLSGMIEGSAKAFQNFNLSTDQFSDAMEYAFKVSQATGVKMSSLLSQASQYGSVFQAIGMDYEDAIALLGQAQKSGLDATQFITAFRTASANAMKGGFKSVSDGIETYFERIRNAKDETRALQIATNAFGSKSAATMVKAIKNGTLSLTAFKNAISVSDETIGKAATDTYDFQEKLQLMKQRLSVELKPAADVVFNAINKLADIFIKVVDFSVKHKNLISGIAIGIGSLATSIAVVTKAVKAWTIAQGILNATMTANPIGIAIAGVAALIAGIVLLVKHFDVVKNALSGLKDFFSDVWNGISGIFKSGINGIISGINWFIEKLNGINFKLPNWKILGEYAGAEIGVNIPVIPQLAKGGFTNGLSIAGEAGREAVISFDPAYRMQNLNLWSKAGQMLGVSDTEASQAAKLLKLDDFSLASLAGSSASVVFDFSNFTWSPQIDAKGSDENVLMEKLKEHEAEFFDWLSDWARMKEVSVYA